MKPSGDLVEGRQIKIVKQETQMSFKLEKVSAVLGKYLREGNVLFNKAGAFKLRRLKRKLPIAIER